jgi:hypothetical protein
VTFKAALPHTHELVHRHVQSAAWRYTTAQYMISPCCLVAAELLHLAAQQVSVPGAAALPALHLAGAAQQLATVCAELAAVICAPAVQTSEKEMRSCILGMAPAMFVLWETIEATWGAQPWSAVPRQSHQPLHAVKADHTREVHSSSCSSFQELAGDPLLATAQQIQSCCRSRVQLVGCSHLHCTSLSGPSAQGLVAGRKGVVCGVCGVARYCSPACQKADWPHHWCTCRRLAAATMAAAAPGGLQQQEEG